MNDACVRCSSGIFRKCSSRYFNGREYILESENVRSDNFFLSKSNDAGGMARRPMPIPTDPENSYSRVTWFASARAPSSPFPAPAQILKLSRRWISIAAACGASFALQTFRWFLRVKKSATVLCFRPEKFSKLESL